MKNLNLLNRKILVTSRKFGHFYFDPFTGMVTGAFLREGFGPLPAKIDVRSLPRSPRGRLLPEYHPEALGFWDKLGNYTRPHDYWVMLREAA